MIDLGITNFGISKVIKKKKYFGVTILRSAGVNTGLTEDNQLKTFLFIKTNAIFPLPVKDRLINGM